MADGKVHNVVDLTQEPIPGDEPIKVKEDRAITEEDRITAQFLGRIEKAYDYQQDNFRTALENMQFVYNNQWSNENLIKRAGRPTLQLNIVAAFINLLVGNARQQKFSINMQQTSGPTAPIPLQQSGTILSSAEVFEGLIRQIPVSYTHLTLPTEA